MAYRWHRRSLAPGVVSLAWLACLLAPAALDASPAGEAHTPKLPSPALLTESLYEPLVARLHDRRWQCAPEAALPCACVLAERGEARVGVERWAPGTDRPQDAALRDVWFADATRAWAGYAARVEPGAGISIVLHDLHLVARPAGSDGLQAVHLRAERARLTADDATLEGVRWEVAFAPESGGAGACEGFGGLTFARAPSPATADATPEARTLATARAVRTGPDGRWRVEGYRTAGLPVATFAAADAAAQPATPGVSGLLVPGLVASGDVVEARAGAYFAGPGVGVVASAAPGRWYGGGLMLVGAGRGESLLLEARHHDGGLSYLASGDATAGDRYMHVAASLEEVGDRVFWQTERLRRGAFFRPWRLSRAGFALSSERHVFVANLAHHTHEHLNGDTTDFAGQVGYATHVDLAAAGTARIGLEHRLARVAPDPLDLPGEPPGSDTASTSSVAQRALANVLWWRGFGREDRAFVRPMLSGRLAFDLTPAEAGWQASSGGHLATGVDASLAISGRFEGVEHLVRPRALVAAELVRLGRVATIDDASDEARAGVGPSRALAGLFVEQRLTLTSGVRIELPVGVLLESDDWTAARRVTPGGVVAARVTTGPARLTLAATCRARCGAWTLIGSGDVAWGRHVRSRHVVSRHVPDLDADRLEPGHARAHVHPPHTDPALRWALGSGAAHALFFDALAPDWQRMPTPFDPREGAASAVHWSSLVVAARQVRWELGVPMRWSDAVRDDPFHVGVETRVSYGFDDLGWRLALGGAADPVTGDWAVMLGMALR